MINPGCTLIAIAGGKGGVGKSVFAANLSIALLMELRSQVLLIDADSKSVGDQSFILGTKPTKTLREITSLQASLSSQPMNTLVATHSSGLSYVGAVYGPEESFSVSKDPMIKALEFFSRTYKFIVVDIGNDIGPIQTAILQEATVALLVATPEVLVVTQTLRLINELMSQTFPKDMLQLVINKVSNTGLSPQSISNQLQMPYIGLIPQDDVSSTMALQKNTPFVFLNPKAPISSAYFEVVRRLTGGVIQKMKALSKPKPVVVAEGANNKSNSEVSSASSGSDARTMLKIRVHNELIRTVDLKKLLDEKKDEKKEKEILEKTKREITVIVDKEAPDLQRDERSKIINEVLDESLGLGPLDALLADPDCSEIMVNGYKKIFIEKGGKVQLNATTFTSNEHLRRIIDRIVAPLGRQINLTNPYVDARLKDGSRVNAIIEPLSIDGPALTIRKFKKGGITPEKYISFGTLNKGMVDFLRICVENGLNIIISGGTGSGKTTLLNMLSSFVSSTERIITIEDAAELQLQQDHVVRLETRPPSGDSTNAITIRDLIRNALRMRPDRIIVGETRDGAALDMLQAMNTGHDGSMTTTHANSPREALARIETLCMMSGMDLPMDAIRQQISSAVHLIVQISRLSDGSRKLLSITEVAGMSGDVITLTEIFRFKEGIPDKNRKITGSFQATGSIPKFIQKLSDKGVNIPRELFSNSDLAVNQGASSGSTGVAPIKKSG